MDDVERYCAEIEWATSWPKTDLSPLRRLPPRTPGRVEAAARRLWARMRGTRRRIPARRREA